MNSMAKTLPKPVSLRPSSPAHRRWFWALMILAVMIIVVGWSMTIRDILRDVPAVRSSMETGVDRAAEKIEEARLNPGARIQETTDAIDALKAGYEAEKQRQEQTSIDPEPYEQEESIN